ncbi:MAG: transposase [Patescibacteria group bacterium]|nr:transposase [Patescibacteria group bacterium]
MPAKNARKQYLENGYYHLYNRGVEKRTIFLDQQDYSVFLSYLKEYLIPKNEKALQEILSNSNTSSKEKDKALKLLHLNNFYNEITLLAYCLMPNHFHFFIKQKNPNSIDKFMNSLCTRYTMYFNKKYKRVGSLYQGVYKAVLVSSEEQFLHLSRYIHKQALASQGLALRSYLRS